MRPRRVMGWPALASFFASSTVLASAGAEVRKKPTGSAAAVVVAAVGAGAAALRVGAGAGVSDDWLHPDPAITPAARIVTNALAFVFMVTPIIDRTQTALRATGMGRRRQRHAGGRAPMRPRATPAVRPTASTGASIAMPKAPIEKRTASPSRKSRATAQA